MPRSPFVEVHDLSPQLGSSAKLKQPTDSLGTLAQCEHAMSKMGHLKLNSIHSKKKIYELLGQLDRTEFPLPHNEDALLVIHFLTNQKQTQFNPFQKVELDSLLFLR